MEGKNPIHLLSGHGKEKTVTEKESGLKTKGAVNSILESEERMWRNSTWNGESRRHKAVI